MNDFIHLLPRIALIGIGATAVMDGWLWLLRRFGVATLNFALIGRWLGHMAQGRFHHAPIARSPAVRGELALGWAFHYAAGIAFAALLVLLQGAGWTVQPSALPAIALGIATVAVPLFVMQPAMGAGFASRNTAAPLRNSLRSVANHTVFGAGLYLSAAALAAITS